MEVRDEVCMVQSSKSVLFESTQSFKDPETTSYRFRKAASIAIKYEYTK